MMPSRRSVLFALPFCALALGLLASAVAVAKAPQPFTADAFAQAQKAGKPILVFVHASWCTTCKAQTPIIAELTADPKFKNLSYFQVDFDRQKDAVKRFGARMQSTLIVFKGSAEAGRSVADTNRAGIAALLNKAL